MQKAISKRTNLAAQFISLFKSGSSAKSYYESMNQALYQLRDEYTMLHYPFFVDESDDFLQAQENLTRYCINSLESLEGKSVLDVGCGNGVQTNFIANHYRPRFITGIDLNRLNVLIANREKTRLDLSRVFFLIDDAQNMKKIDDQSFDVVINIESAFHYPDKQAFLNEVSRVLLPGGRFLIADILTTRRPRYRRGKIWKSKMTLNHWSLDQYMDGLKNARLVVEDTENITDRVIKGFNNYRSYFRQTKKRSLLRTITYRLFYLINIKLNIYLLKTRRQYMIFTGTRPVQQ